jgi:hypothetical protein
VFEAQGELFAKPGFSGCAFVSASAESPSDVVEKAADYRGWVRDLFSGLAREGGVPDPEGLARQLHLLYDGASLSACMDHDLIGRRGGARRSRGIARRRARRAPHSD